MSKRARLATAVIAASVAAIAFAFYLSLDRDSYFFYTEQERASWKFSPRHISLVCAIMIVEAVVWGTALLSAWPRYLWLRCVFALIVLVPWGLFTFQIVMHAPRYVHFHHLWLALVILSLLITALVSGTMQVVSLARQRRAAV
jgi:hypothetical protein